MNLRLPGSHGHVFPWDPPSFGVPDDVLVSMAMRLREEIIQCAIKAAPRRKDQSQQSSPTSVSKGSRDTLSASLSAADEPINFD